MNVAQRVIALGLVLSTIFVGGAVSASVTWAPPSAPTGVTPLSSAAAVRLTWQPAAGAASYTIVRGTSASALTTTVATGVTTTSYKDGSVVNGTAYYYAVRVVSGAGTSLNSQVVRALPRTRSCGSGNAIALENCFPGDAGWKTPNATATVNNGIEGYATSSSIAAGGSVDLKVSAPSGVPYHIEVYRTGWYGGIQGRRIGDQVGLVGVAQPDCASDAATGLVDCSNWSKTGTLSTATDWPSGVYLLKLVRDDNGAQNEIMLTIRDDSRTAPLVFDVPVSTYQAYNNYGERSLYNFNSAGAPTVSGNTRAVKVSFDRPFWQTISGQHDYYTRADIQSVGWLERQGYDISYVDSDDLQRGRARINGRKVLIMGAHDEYVSAEMRKALTVARDAGTHIASLGANGIYWKVRFENSPSTSAQDRTLVSYKSTEGGAPDPVATTSTWRDPLGANTPENALLGGQYVGDEANQNFPLFVTSDQGEHRFWRYTSLPSMAGARAQIGFNIVGWEWDRRASNGLTPAGTVALSSSPVTGNILQDNGRSYAPGSETQESTLYKAASGAYVFDAGTNNWSLGLGKNVDGTGEPDSLIQQATANLLSDMGQRAPAPSGVTLDDTGALVISSRTPASGASGLASDINIDVVFDRPLDPSTVAASQLAVTTSGGAAIPGTVTYNDAARRLRFTPAEPFDGNATYTATVGTGLKGFNGQGLAAASPWTFGVGPGKPPAISSRTPADGAVDRPFTTTVRVVFDRSLDPTTVNASTLTLASSGGPVPATVAYDPATRAATVTPDAPLASLTKYTAQVTTGIKARDGTPLAAGQAWQFLTFQAITVTSRAPAVLDSSVSTRTDVRATFNRAADASTISASAFTLTDGNGAAVAGAVSYDAATRTARLVPATALDAGQTYTATLAPTVKAIDGAPLSGTTTWSFSTSLTPVPIPAVSSTTPAGGATGAAIGDPIRVTFDRPVDPGTLTASSFTLSGADGVPLAASIAYDSATNTATLSSSAELEVSSPYTARVTTAVRSAAGEPLASDVSWSYTTGGCPCSLNGNRTPAEVRKPVSDGASGPGPYALEVGVKLTVDEPTRITTLRYYRSPGETGTHVGHVWTVGGSEIAHVAFNGETFAGWQTQALPTPVTLRPGRTYTVSVGLNDYYVVTRGGLNTARKAGPLRTVGDSTNGAFGRTLSVKPAESYASSDFFVDVVGEPGTGAPVTPKVVTQSPLDGVTGVSRGTAIRATFNVPLDPTTVNAVTFTLRETGGAVVPASVSYDEASGTASLVPSGQMATGTAYTATLWTGVQAHDGTALPSPVSWNFTTTDGTGPQPIAFSPADSVAEISGDTDVRATFSQPLSPATVTSSTVTLAPSAGGSSVVAAITYDAVTNTIVLTPSIPLAPSTSYRATVRSGVTSSGGTPLQAAITWTFSTSACPCQLFPDVARPDADQRPVQDGRGGPGPFSYEMGVKVRVSQAASLSAIRFYKSVGETGTHIGRLWTAGGNEIAQVVFTGESPWGWQTQALATPVKLTPGTTYVVSVGLNDYYVVSGGRMANSIVSGPMSSVADGANDVFGAAAGVFPTDSWNNGNYFIDAVVR